MSDVPTQRDSFATSTEPILDFLDTKYIAADVASFTDLVSRLHRDLHQPEKKKFQTPRKNSSPIPGSWMVFEHCGMILGQGRVVWVALSGQEDSGDLFQSWAAIRETPGMEHRLPRQIKDKWFWEGNFHVAAE